MYKRQLQSPDSDFICLFSTNQCYVGIFLYLLAINKEEDNKQDGRYQIAHVIHERSKENIVVGNEIEIFHFCLLYTSHSDTRKSSATPDRVLRNYWVHLLFFTDAIDKIQGEC